MTTEKHNSEHNELLYLSIRENETNSEENNALNLEHNVRKPTTNASCEW